MVVSRLDDVSTGAACRLALYGDLLSWLLPSTAYNVLKAALFGWSSRKGVAADNHAATSVFCKPQTLIYLPFP